MVGLVKKNPHKKARGSRCKHETSPSRKARPSKGGLFLARSPFYEDFSLPGVVKYGGEIKED
jgi:hypothetical protein